MEDLAHDITHTLKQDKLAAPPVSTSRFMQEQVGKFTTSALGHSLTYDRSDSKIVPKNGYVITASQEYAGVGGKNKYLKHELESKYFVSFVQNKYTLKLAANTGDIRGTQGKTVRISDRFNLGDYSLRGFTSAGIGPRDKKTEEALGGQKYYSLSAELNFPLGAPDEFNLSGACFVDAGSVWDIKLNSKSTYTKNDFYSDRSMRSSFGFGLIWITRIAPIRIDWALPIKQKSYDDTNRFHFRFATHF